MPKVNRRRFFVALLAPFLAKPAGEVFLSLPADKFPMKMPRFNGMLEGADYDLCPNWEGSLYPTYDSITRMAPVSKLLPLDENGEDVLTRVTKRYMAAQDKMWNFGTLGPEIASKKGENE